MQILHRVITGSLCLLSFACGTGVAYQAEPSAPPPKTVESAEQATAELFPVGRHKARGMLRFRATEKGVLLRGKITGLANGNFGFSIRDKADCIGADAKALGPYFNPDANPESPLGRLEDVNANAEGVVELQREVEKLRLQGSKAILGKAIVVHAWPHDPKVEPKDVPLVACGVIRAD